MPLWAWEIPWNSNHHRLRYEHLIPPPRRHRRHRGRPLLQLLATTTMILMMPAATSKKWSDSCVKSYTCSGLYRMIRMIGRITRQKQQHNYCDSMRHSNCPINDEGIRFMRRRGCHVHHPNDDCHSYINSNQLLPI